MSILYMIDFFTREGLYADDKRNAGKSRTPDTL